MLRPSGRANTRCSVCRFDPGGLHVQLSPAPGTGLQSPETGSQNRRYRDLSWRQRPHVSHLNPRKCPQIAGYLSETRKHRFASDCVVVDAAWIEPVSTSNSLLAGNLAGNFLKKGPPRAILASKTITASIAYERIPCLTEQGIFLREQGILSREQGILATVAPGTQHPCQKPLQPWVSREIRGQRTPDSGQ